MFRAGVHTHAELSSSRISQTEKSSEIHLHAQEQFCSMMRSSGIHLLKIIGVTFPLEFPFMWDSQKQFGSVLRNATRPAILRAMQTRTKYHSQNHAKTSAMQQRLLTCLKSKLNENAFVGYNWYKCTSNF